MRLDVFYWQHIFHEAVIMKGDESFRVQTKGLSSWNPTELVSLKMLHSFIPAHRYLWVRFKFPSSYIISFLLITAALFYFKRIFIVRCFDDKARPDRTYGAVPGQGNEANTQLEALFQWAESRRKCNQPLGAVRLLQSNNSTFWISRDCAAKPEHSTTETGVFGHQEERLV